MNKMNPAIKARWVAALRSGEYKQGQGYLRTSDGWCCLGVLCDVAAKDGVADWWTTEHGDYRIGEDEYAGLCTPPKCVDAWLGTPIFDARVDIGGVVVPLVEHNDRRKRTFAEIADAIEAQL